MKVIRFNENIVIVIKSLVLTIFALVLLSLILPLMQSVGFNVLGDSLLGNVLLELTILLVQCLIIRKYKKDSFLNAIGLNYDKASIKNVIKGVLIGLIGVILIYSMVFLFRICSLEGTGFQFFDTKIILLFMHSMFIRAFFAGVCEEVFFRGVLQNYLSKYKGKLFGLLASSLVFTVFHCTRYQSIYQLSSVLFGGLALGYLYLITKSLYMSIGLHVATDFFINLLNTKDQPCLLAFDLNANMSLDYLTKIIFMLTAFLYLVLLIILVLKKRDGKSKLDI